jgi:ribonucleoside-diphosphate reductase alpha chain
MKYETFSKHRKEGQANGTVPSWMATAGYQLFVEKYLYKAKNPREQFERIARTAAKHAPKTSPDGRTWEDKFFEVLWNGWVACSTPVLANMGTTRGCPVSCAGSIIEDSILGFYDSYREVAVLTKQGFGTATDLTPIRPRGSAISVGGKASGVIPVLRSQVQSMKDVSQGTARRGAFAGYLDIMHGDFWEVAEELEKHPDSLNIGWTITDEYIRLLNEGDEEASKRFSRALKVKMVTGKGYFFFKDKVNRARPMTYVNNGLFVNNSQLCVAPETLILTNKGHQTIKELAGKEAIVWNGKQWSTVTVEKTGTSQKLVKVVTDSGYELNCTEYHKFYVKENGHRHGKIVEKRAHELQAGDKLIKLSTPIIEGIKNLHLAYQNGFYSGDGCSVGEDSRIYLYGGKRLLKHLFESHAKNWVTQDNQDREYFNVPNLEEKFFVPDAFYSVQSRLDWFAGLLDSDGTVCRIGKSQTLQIASVEPEFLREIQLMLQTLGVQSKVRKARDAGKYLLPANDGSGENKEYSCKKVERLLISGMGIVQLKKLGLHTHRLEISDHVPDRNAERFVEVFEVVDEGRYDDTYCFVEHLEHKGVFNGILTGQCSEIFLHNDAEHTYTCVLAWMNLSKSDEWEGTDAVFVATVFLDCVVSEFLEQARHIKGMEKAVRSTEKSRAIGLGAGGFHTYLQEHMMPWGSFETHQYNNRIFKHINDESLKASQWLAIQLGEPEWCKGSGLRFTHRMAVAPTKSTALAYGGISEGINPDSAYCFTQSTSAGEMDRVVPALLALIKSKGLDIEKCIADVVQGYGSVQHVDWLNAEEKLVFLTAFEIRQADILRLAATRQQHIDQGQSLNLFIPKNAKEEDVAALHKEAFLNERIHSLYYIYSSRGVISSNSECLACQ